MIVDSHTQSSMDMVILSFDKGFPLKVLVIIHLSSTKIRCLTLSLNGGMVVDSHCTLVL